MFQSFTGNSRRPRQVNLSGRSGNPFAPKPTSQVNNALKPPGGGGNALANAQIERRARQAERDRLSASRTIQRVWRGHDGRRRLRSQRTEILKTNEDFLSAKGPDGRTIEDVRHHLRLLVHTVWPRFGDDEWTAERILLAGQWVYEKTPAIIQKLRLEGEQGGWPSLMRAFIKLLIRFLGTVFFPSQQLRAKKLSAATTDQSLPDANTKAFDEMEEHFPGIREQMQRIFVLLGALITTFDAYNQVDWKSLRLTLPRQGHSETPIRETTIPDLYYRLMGRMSVLGWLSGVQHQQEALVTAILQEQMPDIRNLGFVPSLVVAPASSLMQNASPEQQEHIYKSIILGLMIVSDLPEDIISAVRSVLNTDLFFRTARDLVVDQNQQVEQNDCQRLLGNSIRLAKQKHPGSVGQSDDSSRTYFTIEFLSFVSSVLEMFNSVRELDHFMSLQLQSLANADMIGDLFEKTNFLEGHSSGGEEREADVLSDYILNILRLLPRQANDIRMHLYINHRTRNKGKEVGLKSAVRFFWDAFANSNLLKQALRGWVEVKNLLPGSSTRLRSQWKVVVLFIEIYSFGLRFQDDDEFIGGLNSTNDLKSSQSSTLTLTEIQKLVEFLKNASYCLYLKNAVELGEKPPLEASDLKSVFSSTTNLGDSTRSTSSAHLRKINMQQLKDSVTALLRMLYERDSRRKFLPDGSFLMIVDEAESQHFVKSVMREAVLKQRLDEEDSDNDEEEGGGIEDLESYTTERDRLQGAITSQHLRRVQRQSQREHHQRLLARRRARQEAAPRVELLENIPFLIQFETRVQIFRMHVETDMAERRGGDTDPDRWRLNLHVNRDPHSAMGILSAHQAELRRESIFADAFEAFDKLGEGLKEPIRISFVGEEGIDGGGVTKEFLTSVINDVFRVNSHYHLFAENDDHMLYPNPHVLDEIDAEFDMIAASGNPVKAQDRLQARKRVLEYYRFAGRLVGKCLYEGILVDIPVARFFVTKWALTGGDGAAKHETTYRPGLNDMWDYDKAIYRGLLDLKSTSDDVSTWGMTFAVDEMVGGKQIERELKPGGSDTTVNNQNRLEYIRWMVNYYLVSCQGRQTRAFLDGLSSIIKPTWLRMFNEAEIRVLLGGESRPIDVEDLRNNTVYSGVYQIGDDGQEHETIKMFWETMREIEDTDRRKLLQYVTSTPNAPLMGFVHLNPRFSIRDSQSDQGRLPTSSTCANLLKLPIYRTKEALRDRLLTAIRSGAGFDLS